MTDNIDLNQSGINSKLNIKLKNAQYRFILFFFIIKKRKWCRSIKKARKKLWFKYKKKIRIIFLVI